MADTPTTERLQFLVGRIVELVCLAEFTSYLNLTGGPIVSVMGSFTHRVSKQSPRSSDFPLKETTLCQLAGQSIVSVNVGADKSLVLELSGDQSLTVHTEDGHYEAYHVASGNDLFIGM